MMAYGALILIVSSLMALGRQCSRRWRAFCWDSGQPCFVAGSTLGDQLHTRARPGPGYPTYACIAGIRTGSLGDRRDLCRRRHVGDRPHRAGLTLLFAVAGIWLTRRNSCRPSWFVAPAS